MTPQQPTNPYPSLMCLFDQATGRLSPSASNVLLSFCYFRLGAVLFRPITRSHIRLQWRPTPTAVRRHAPYHTLGATDAIQSP